MWLPHLCLTLSLSLTHTYTHTQLHMHTQTHSLTPGGLLSRLLPLGLSFLRSQQIHWSLQVSLQSLFTAGYSHHPPSGTLQPRSHAPSPPARTHTRRYTLQLCLWLFINTANTCMRPTVTTHSVHVITRTQALSPGQHCWGLHAGLLRGYPPPFDWIYDCGSPFPISTDWLGANLSQQTPAEDKGGCGRRPLLNWNKFATAATVCICCH